MRPALLLSVVLALPVACATSPPGEPKPAAEPGASQGEPEPSTGVPADPKREAAETLATAAAPELEANEPGSGEAPLERDGASVLEELRELGEAAATESGPKGGGSIRAKKEAALARKSRLEREGNLEAKVEAISRGRFPFVALRLRVTRPARSREGAGVAKGSILVVVPRLMITGRNVDLGDPASELNAGAYYLQRGDKVAVRLGEKRGRTWIADHVERK